MNSTKLIGKIFAPRQREIDLYGTKAEEIQGRVFRKLIQSASATEWGKKYDFSQIRNYTDFQRVPIQTYEDVKGYVPRHAKITVEGFDVLTNKDVKIVARGFLAICLQHELDHFDGVLYYDHINKEYPLVPIENAMVIE